MMDWIDETKMNTKFFMYFDCYNNVYIYMQWSVLEIDVF